MQARNYLTALVLGKCPRCREGNIFTYPVNRIGKFNVMNKTCPHCGVRLEPEPGFYQGAMYVGYGFTVAFLVFISAILYLLGDFSEWVYIGVTIGVLILFAPLNYRWSRIVYLHLFGGIKYNPRLSQPK
ncbi:DUF983 domain-containing protein [Chryseolinea sp. H1M3-3]|uniref:DUF983 domain-containing protein n=1 Tax=Chryseolinea sp. H1M3-3 TaxID=3034144 RepID=UPI0023EDD414|nr:DUF983 domain-containing protein [Chryseolinea sp. H1M3-3]